MDAAWVMLIIANIWLASDNPDNKVFGMVWLAVAVVVAVANTMWIMFIN